MRIFHLYIKSPVTHVFHTSLSYLCKHYILGVSKGTLDRKEFSIFENDYCILYKGELKQTKRKRKSRT